MNLDEQTWNLWLKLSNENEIEDYDLSSFNHLQVGGFLKELQWIKDNKDKYNKDKINNQINKWSIRLENYIKFYLMKNQTI